MAETTAGSLLQVRNKGVILQMDLTTLVTLIQQDGVDADTEVQGEQFTGGEWRRLGELDVYRALRPDKPKPQVPGPGSTGKEMAESYEQNLQGYFGSPVISIRLRDNGQLVLRIYGSELFDVTKIDPASVRMGAGITWVAVARVAFWLVTVKSSAPSTVPCRSRINRVAALTT